MKFEYDEKKSLLNLKKHKIDFEQAQVLWYSDNIILDSKYSGEKRRLIIGKIEAKYYTAIYTDRNKAMRIISCRRSREEERRLFDEIQTKDR